MKSAMNRRNWISGITSALLALSVGGVSSLQAAEPTSVSDLSVFRTAAFEVLSAEELRARFDQLYAVSDLHGSLARTQQLFLKSKITATGPDGKVRWNGSLSPGNRKLLIVVGDSIDKGEDSAGVLLFLQKLQTQAAVAGGKVIVLLGNHEVDFLGGSSTSDEEGDFIESVLEHAGDVRGVHRGENLRRSDVLSSEIGEILKSMPVAAVVGGWMFAHSGYIAASGSSGNAPALHQKIRKISNAFSNGRYELLTEAARGERLGSILWAHDWWKTDLAGNMRRLRALGISGLAVGHEPGSLEVRGQIALHERFEMLKLDSGMNAEANDSEGRMLSCSIRDILPPGATSLQMRSARGTAICSQIKPGGEAASIPLSRAGR